MSKTTKILLQQKSGLLSDLQSDTIFGHFCWRMREIAGEEKLKEFLKFYKNNEPVFTISDNLFEKDGEVFFPKPIYSRPISEKEKLTKAEKLKQMCIYKERKSKKYIDKDTLNFFLSGDYENYEKNIDNSESIKTFEDHLRTNVQISRDTLTAEKGKLFSYSPKYLNSHLKKNESPVDMCLLIKVIDQKNYVDFNCEELIKEVFRIGYGKKKSSGFGEFEIKGDITEYDEINEPVNSNGFICFSNYLPSKDEKITDSYYDYHVKYGKLGEQYSQSDKPFKKPIIFFTQGSCFKTSNKEEWYGRCTNESDKISTKPEVIQNGIAFTLKIKI